MATTPRSSSDGTTDPTTDPTGATGRAVARWAGPALIAAAAVNVTAEAVVAAAWDQRAYSYTQDYVNFLGSPFAGTFQGVAISSPLWWLMTAAWILTGALVAAAALALAQPLTGWRARATAGVGAAAGVTLVLFAVFPLGPARMGDPTLFLYLLGAFGSIIFGNALAIVVGLSTRRLHLPRWLSLTSITLGVIGLVNIGATYGWAPTGVAERISVYSYLLWALLTGAALLITRRTRAARR